MKASLSSQGVTLRGSAVRAAGMAVLQGFSLCPIPAESTHAVLPCVSTFLYPSSGSGREQPYSCLQCPGAAPWLFSPRVPQVPSCGRIVVQCLAEVLLPELLTKIQLQDTSILLCWKVLALLHAPTACWQSTSWSTRGNNSTFWDCPCGALGLHGGMVP